MKHETSRKDALGNTIDRRVMNDAEVKTLLADCSKPLGTSGQLTKIYIPNDCPNERIYVRSI